MNFIETALFFYFYLFSVLVLFETTSNVYITKRSINLLKAMPALPINIGFETQHYSFYYQATAGFHLPI